MVIHEGRYYLTTEPQPQDGFDGNAWKNLTLEQRSGDGAFLLGDSLPVEGVGDCFRDRHSFLRKKENTYMIETMTNSMWRQQMSQMPHLPTVRISKK